MDPKLPSEWAVKMAMRQVMAGNTNTGDEREMMELALELDELREDICRPMETEEPKEVPVTFDLDAHPFDPPSKVGREPQMGSPSGDSILFTKKEMGDGLDIVIPDDEDVPF